MNWFKVVTTRAHAGVLRDESGLIQVDSTKIWTNATDTFVRPEHYEQVVLKYDPIDLRWLYVVQVAPRRKPICEGLEEQASGQVNKEEQTSEQVDEEEQATEEVDEEEHEEQAKEEELE